MNPEEPDTWEPIPVPNPGENLLENAPGDTSGQVSDLVLDADQMARELKRRARKPLFPFGFCCDT